MRVLGIDPGYGRCGMAIVEKIDGRERLIHSDCVETSAGSPFPERLSHVVVECARLIEKYGPECMAIEKLYFSKNQKTAMQVAEVRGALIACAAEHGIDVFEYTPGQIKSAAAGSGAADKKQVAAMLHLLIAIEKEIRFDDEYDAIAAALAHLSHARQRAVV